MCLDNIEKYKGKKETMIAYKVLRKQTCDNGRFVPPCRGDEVFEKGKWNKADSLITTDKLVPKNILPHLGRICVFKNESDAIEYALGSEVIYKVECKGIDYTGTQSNKGDKLDCYLVREFKLVKEVCLKGISTL